VIDVYLGSNELKKLIVERSFKLEIPLRYICNEAGIEYSKFINSYINSRSNKNCKVTEKQFDKIFEILGIKVRTQFLILSEESGYYAKEVKKELEQKYVS